MVQDATDEGGLDDEGEDLHLFPAPPTGQRVDLVDTVNELGPSLSQNAWTRGSLCHLFRRVAVSEARGTNAIGVGALETDEMFVVFGDVDEDTR